LAVLNNEPFCVQFVMSYDPYVYESTQFIPQKALTLSCKVDECKPLALGIYIGGFAALWVPEQLYCGGARGPCNSIP
jgi:hypothetical protein